MSGTVAILALVFGIDAFRRRRELPTDVGIVAAGALLALGGYVVLAAVSGPLLDGLDISAPNARIAAGLTLGLGAMFDLFRRAPDPTSVPEGPMAALAPAFFPALFRPDIGVLALSAGADRGVAVVLVGSAVGLGACVAWLALAHRTVTGPLGVRIEQGLGFLATAATVWLAVDITVDGVIDV